MKQTKHRHKRSRFRRRRARPTLRFTPYAWGKLLFLRDLGPTEVGGFGVSAAGDLLLVEDICLVGQTCTPITVRFHDEAVADHFDRQVDAGLKPEQFGRIWLHTHPGHWAEPSGTDEETFARCFGRADWAVMGILAQGGQAYARRRFGVGPCGELELPVAVDFEQPFAGADHDRWTQEYLQFVEPVTVWSTGWLENTPQPDPFAGLPDSGMEPWPFDVADNRVFDSPTLDELREAAHAT